MTTTPKPRRRWLQYSLRTLMVLMLLISVPLGWFAYKTKQERERRKAMNAIVRLGGEMNFVPTSGGLARTLRARLGEMLGEHWTDDVWGVDLLGAGVTDDELSHLNELKDLRALDLNQNHITNAGLDHIKELSRLRFLYLDGTQVMTRGCGVCRG